MKYTTEQLEYVRLNYVGSSSSARLISQTLGIKLDSVFYIIKKLGIGKSKRKGRAWTKDEDEALIEEISTLQILTIASKHKRSPCAIRDRLQLLGVSRKGKDGWYNGQEVCQIFGHSTLWLTRRIRQGIIVPKKRDYGGRYEYEISRQALIDYIRAYPMDIDGRKLDMFSFIELTLGIKRQKDWVNH